MTRFATQANMIMHYRTHPIHIALGLRTALMLVFGFQGLVSGTLDVTSLHAAETGMASGHSILKNDNQRSSRAEGPATIAAAEPILKPEKESDRSKAGKKPRRLIRKPAAGAPQSEPTQKSVQDRSSTMPIAVDQGDSRDQGLGGWNGQVGSGHESGSPTGFVRKLRHNHDAKSDGVFGSHRGGSGIDWFVDRRSRIGWIIFRQGAKCPESDETVARFAAASYGSAGHAWPSSPST